MTIMREIIKNLALRARTPRTVKSESFRHNADNVDMLTNHAHGYEVRHGGKRVCEWLRGIVIIPYSGKAGSGLATLR